MSERAETGVFRPRSMNIRVYLHRRLLHEKSRETDSEDAGMSVNTDATVIYCDPHERSMRFAAAFTSQKQRLCGAEC